jgi:hypothetical protein
VGVDTNHALIEVSSTERTLSLPFRKSTDYFQWYMTVYC